MADAPVVLLLHGFPTSKASDHGAAVNNWNFDFPPLPAGAIPSEVFAVQRTLKLAGSTTDSDISVRSARPSLH